MGQVADDLYCVIALGWPYTTEPRDFACPGPRPVSEKQEGLLWLATAISVISEEAEAGCVKEGENDLTREQSK